MPRKLIDLTGQRFGRFLVLERGPFPNGKLGWKCRCRCGQLRTVQGAGLRNGRHRSCGCLKKEMQEKGGWQLIHGYSRRGRAHPLYGRWNMMFQRCNNPKNKSYHRYGGRGIRICRAWRSFPAFLEWARKSGWKKSCSLDRKNNEGNYTPRNCRWATPSMQANNRCPVKLRKRDVEKIKRACLDAPLGSRTTRKLELAAKFDVSLSTIYDIRGHRTHVSV